MQITQRSSPNQAVGRAGWSPDIIVCHITEGSFDGAVSWLTNRESQVSSHYVVAQDGRITQLVPLENTAWANGTTTNAADSRGNMHSRLTAVQKRAVNANLYTISIEHEGRLSETGGALTPAQQAATTWLIAHIRDEVKRIYGTDIPLNREHIVGHADIAPRWKPNCPGAKFPFDEIIRNLSAGTEQTSTPKSTAPSPWAKDAWQWATQNKLTDGTSPQAMPTREQMIQLLYNYDRFIR